MPFWSTQTLRAKVPAERLIEPYDATRVVHAAYEMGVGPEAFITSRSLDKTEISAGTKIVIPPGQFGLLITREVVYVPDYAIAFISIRARIKFQGLVNVSGFHVDPGYRGQLKFAVYNAGSRDIVLDQNERVFMIWYADLDQRDSLPYPARTLAPNVITAEDVSRIQGDVASPATLKKQLDELKTEVEKKFHAGEQTRMFNRSVLMLLLGVAITIGMTLVKPYFESDKKAPKDTLTTQAAQSSQSGNQPVSPSPARHW
jgi:dCTP deaminase